MGDCSSSGRTAELGVASLLARPFGLARRERDGARALDSSKRRSPQVAAASTVSPATCQPPCDTNAPCCIPATAAAAERSRTRT